MEELLNEIKKTEHTIRKLKRDTETEISRILQKGKETAASLIEHEREKLRRESAEKIQEFSEKAALQRKKGMKEAESEIRALDQKAKRNSEKAVEKILALVEEEIHA